jgi:tight adherence protein B
VHRRLTLSRERRGSPATLSRDDAAELCGRLAALAEAGLPPSRAWDALRSGRGPAAEAAEVVAAMLEAGGSAPEGLRLAAGRLGGPGAVALDWLATVSEVVERSGAPSAFVLDRISHGMLAEIARASERETALAGPRTTATLLSWLPLVGLLLGALTGANPVSALAGSPVGWGCGALGVGFWLVGRAWIRHLVAVVVRAGESS